MLFLNLLQHVEALETPNSVSFGLLLLLEFQHLGGVLELGNLFLPLSVS